MIGAIPGLGSVTALAVLIPITYYMSPLSAIAFLVGVNKGGTSGGAVPAILLNAPGTPEAAATAFDGYPMARKGQANRAMRFALYSSVTGAAHAAQPVMLTPRAMPRWYSTTARWAHANSSATGKTCCARH